MKLGSVRYEAYFLDKIYIDEWVYRSKRGSYGYMIMKIKGVTWIKLSKRHGDFGIPSKVPSWCRQRFHLERGLPYSPTKVGSVKKLASQLRAEIRVYGEDFVEEEGEPTLGVKLKKTQTYYKRLVNKR